MLLSLMLSEAIPCGMLLGLPEARRDSKLEQKQSRAP
jgi:hypothetical protein